MTKTKILSAVIILSAAIATRCSPRTVVHWGREAATVWSHSLVRRITAEAIINGMVSPHSMKPILALGWRGRSRAAVLGPLETSVLFPKFVIRSRVR